MSRKQYKEKMVSSGMLWIPNLTDYVQKYVHIDCEYFSEFFQNIYVTYVTNPLIGRDLAQP